VTNCAATNNTSPVLLLIARRSAWCASSAAALEVALTAGVFDQQVVLVLLEEAVLQLLPAQNGQVLGLKTYANQLPALELYGITQVYVDGAALQHYGLSLQDCQIPVQVLATGLLAELLASSRTVLVF
jgi:tRNA 2-thiouridine synthesizing protein C